MRKQHLKRHYRVAQKDIHSLPHGGVFMGEHHRHRFLLIGLLLVCGAFLKGFIFGIIVNRNSDLED